MPYCVQCGVELDPDAQSCPLCSTHVISLESERMKSENKNQMLPSHQPPSNFDRHLWLQLVSVGLAAPVLICLLIDFLFDGNIGWAWYVAAGFGLVWAWSIFPFLRERNIAPLWIALDGAALLLFLYFIEKLSGKTMWFLPLALPIALAFIILLEVFVILIQKRVLKELHILSTFLLGIACYCLIIDGFVSEYIANDGGLDWSLIVVVACIAFAVVLAILQRRRWIVEELKYWFRV